MPVVKPGLPAPRGLQLWVDLPKQHKMVEPSYQELDKAGIPSAWPEGAGGPIEIRIISGESHGVSSPVRPLGGCWYFHVIVKEKGKTVFQPIPRGWTAFAYVLKGAVVVNPEQDRAVHEPFHTLVFSNAEDGVAIESAEDGTEFVLVRRIQASAALDLLLTDTQIAGEPLDQPVMQYGPFVMLDREGIQQTLRDCG